MTDKGKFHGVTTTLDGTDGTNGTNGVCPSVRPLDMPIADASPEPNPTGTPTPIPRVSAIRQARPGDRVSPDTRPTLDTVNSGKWHLNSPRVQRCRVMPCGGILRSSSSANNNNNCSDSRCLFLRASRESLVQRVRADSALCGLGLILRWILGARLRDIHAILSVAFK